MNKKVDDASQALRDAVKEHAKLLSKSKTRPDKLAKAASRLRAAASRYTELVTTRSGTSSPLVGILDPRLDEASVSSLTAERDRLKGNRAKREGNPTEHAHAS